MADTAYRELTGDPGTVRARGVDHIQRADRMILGAGAVTNVVDHEAATGEAAERLREAASGVHQSIRAAEAAYRKVGGAWAMGWLAI